MNKYAKFAALIVIIIGTLVWLATANVGETQTYYKTIEELKTMGDKASSKRLRVAGDVVKGSIERKGSEVAFILSGEGQQLRVRYTGSEPLPDTFRDGAQALAEGKLGEDGVFQAGKIQAKCASKYAPKNGAKPGEAPVYGDPQKISESKPATQGM
jgi:cytochrome c-type biogenesis protein CcmE